ncbi:MAG TPA: hypothetical protein VNL14_06245 [Candidatus Acidoferrales bacterium]|nr:hypothetical protein [Candidatus Acidoferrales bacterium]
MKFGSRVFGAAVLLLLSAASGAVAEENDLSRILQPLPRYDPFEKPPPAPEFFPDEVDRRVRAALIDSLTGQNSKLEDHVRFFREKDAELRRERGVVTGLTDYVADLHANTITDRARYLEAQEKALRSVSSPEHKKTIEARLRNDELKRAEELQWRGMLSRFSGAVNTFLSSVDLISIVSGSYIAAAVDAALNQALSRAPAMPEDERRALALYREYLKRNPADEKNAEIWKRIEALERKQKSFLVARELEKAREALRKKDIRAAAFRYELALLIDPESKEAQSALEKIASDEQKQREAREEALRVPAAPAPSQEPEAVAELLYALALREPAAIESAAGELQSQHAGKPLADAARDALAVALEIQGKHEQAAKVLETIAKSGSERDRRRAELLLKDPEYNLLRSFEEARSRHKLDTVKFVLLGEDFLRRNLLIGAAPMITYGAAGATTMGAANVLIMGTNLLAVLTADPVPSQEVRDTGAAYVRQHPESESAAAVYRVLAEAYEKQGLYERALAYYRLAGNMPAEKAAELNEKAAQALLSAAEKSDDRETRRMYLQAILDHYGESQAAAQALPKLSQMAKAENQGIRVSKKFLMDHPELYGPAGLRLKPALFDNNPQNMELADDGVNLVNDRELLLHFQSPWGVQTQSYLVDQELTDNFKVALRKKNYDIALQDVNQRPQGSAGGFKNMPKSLLQGEWARKPELPPEGTDMVFRREAGSPGGSPAHHQFLAESEKDPRALKLPPIQGNISGRGFNLTGSVPAGLWGNRIAVGTDEKSPYASLQLPIPLLQGFIPVDFLFQSRPGRVSLYPQIHTGKAPQEDKELYR